MLHLKGGIANPSTLYWGKLMKLTIRREEFTSFPRRSVTKETYREKKGDHW